MLCCETTKILEYPAPEQPCPTKDDVRELARIFKPLIKISDQIEAIRLRAMAGRFIFATSYCQNAEEHLGGRTVE